jgi:hypothetical protein
MKTVLSLIILLSSVFTFARTEICPDKAPSEIWPVVEVKVTLNNKKNWYNYLYTVSNNVPEAKVPIWRFSLEMDSEPISTAAPAGWEKAVYDKKNHELYWVYNDAKDSTIKPDGKLSGFEVVSKREPGLIRYYADGDVADTPIVKFEPEEDETDPQSIACPGFYNGEGNSDYVTGATKGPSMSDRQEIKIRVKKTGTKAWGGSLNLPGEMEVSPVDYDQLDVIILGTKNLDVNKIDPTSVQFGPGKATFIPVRKTIVNKFDELTDDEFKQAVAKSKSQHLTLGFNTNDVEARCNVDHSLFLTAKTLEGKTLMGAVNIRPVPCDKRTFAREAKKEKYHKKN